MKHPKITAYTIFKRTFALSAVAQTKHCVQRSQSKSSLDLVSFLSTCCAKWVLYELSRMMRLTTQTLAKNAFQKGT